MQKIKVKAVGLKNACLQGKSQPVQRSSDCYADIRLGISLVDERLNAASRKRKIHDAPLSIEEKIFQNK